MLKEIITMLLEHCPVKVSVLQEHTIVKNKNLEPEYLVVVKPIRVFFDEKQANEAAAFMQQRKPQNVYLVEPSVITKFEGAKK